MTRIRPVVFTTGEGSDATGGSGRCAAAGNISETIVPRPTSDSMVIAAAMLLHDRFDGRQTQAAAAWLLS